MIPPSSAPANAGVVESLTGFGTDKPAKSLGAFDAPQAVVPVTLGTGKSPLTPKPSTEHVSLNVGTGALTPADKPVAIPKVDWPKPATVVQAAGEAGKIPGYKAVITYVGDGDSAFAKNKDGSSLECRIDSIDAPEVAHPKVGKAGQAFGEESKKTLQDMILNKEVTVRVSQPAAAGKNYGRALCQIEIEGQNIDKKMLQQGMAWVYKTYANTDLGAIQAEAKANKRGLWADPAPINPAAFRYGK